MGTFICQVDGEQSVICLASFHSLAFEGRRERNGYMEKGFYSVPHLTSLIPIEFSKVIHRLKEFTAPRYIP